jgi:uncharacterized Fe-S center protein
VALDAVATKLTGLNPMHIHTTKNAADRGLGIAQLSAIEILGERIQEIEVKDFKQSAIAVGLIRKKVPAFMHAFIQHQLVLIPRVLQKKCTACEECINICPKEAVQMQKGIARIVKSRCIRCMCCHEVCRFHAIKLGQKFFGRIVRGMTTAYKKVMAALS